MINIRYISIPLTVMLLMIFLFAPSILQARSKPKITKCDLQYLNMSNSVNVSVQWQSANPVSTVKIYLGREKEIPVDEYDNRRNPHGYTGEITTVIQLDQVQAESLAYIVQVEDELRQKSEQATGKLTFVKRTGAAEDNWGRDDSHARSLGTQSGQLPGRSEIVDKLITVIDKYDLAPSVAYIKISHVAPDRVSFNIRITDDKNLSQLIIRILDTNGNRMVQEQVVSGIFGKFWEGYSSIFTLPVGKYQVSAVAVDAGGNASKEKLEPFEVTQSVSPVTPPEPTQVPYITAGDPASTMPVTQPTYSGDTTVPIDTTVPTPTEQQPIQDASQTGFVMTSIQPMDAVNAGAMWRLDEDQWQPAGMAVSGIAPGQHTIEFNDVPGWTKPPSQTVTVQSSLVTSAEGTYSR